MPEDLVDTGRRARKKRATLLALKAAAIELVAERGLANVTVEEIAEAADVSERTFFNYFPSKEAAVVGDDPAQVESMRAELLALPAGLAPLEALRRVLVDRARAIAEDLDLSGEDHSVWMRRFATLRAQPELLVAYAKHLAAIERVLTEALLERLGGEERLRGYASLVTTSALGAVRSAAVCGGAEVGTESFVERAAAALDLLARGLPFETPPPPPAGRRPGATAAPVRRPTGVVRDGRASGVPHRRVSAPGGGPR